MSSYGQLEAIGGPDGRHVVAHGHISSVITMRFTCRCENFVYPIPVLPCLGISRLWDYLTTKPTSGLNDPLWSINRSPKEK